MASVIRMPEVLAGVTEAVLSQWMMSEGQEVAMGDVLAEIETEKANVDYQAEEEGTLARLLVAPGQSVEVGTPIAVFSAPGDSADDIDAAVATAGAISAPTEAPAAPATTAPETEVSSQPAPNSPPTTPGGRIYVSPLVRKRAREEGIDLSLVTGTGRWADCQKTLSPFSHRERAHRLLRQRLLRRPFPVPREVLVTPILLTRECVALSLAV